MKKSISILCAMALLGVFLLPNVSNADDDLPRGSQLSRSENELCTSGVARRCIGVGNLCEITIGWDCEIIPE